MFSSIMPGLPSISIFYAAGGVGSCAHRVMAPTKETRRTGIVLPTFMEESFVFAVFHPGKLTAKPRPAELRDAPRTGAPTNRRNAAIAEPQLLRACRRCWRSAQAAGRRPLRQFCTEECRGCRWRRPGVCRGRFSAARRSGSGERSRCRPRPSPTWPRRWTRCPARGPAGSSNMPR